jgi:hypothetical protein
METAARNYLREMNFTEQLFEAMVRVPPDEIRLLSFREAREFGLEGTDPVEQEIDDAEMSAYYGISKEKYLQRKSTAYKACPIPDNLHSKEDWRERENCRQAYMWGLDVATYKARRAQVEKVCSNSFPKDEYYSCQIRVMRGGR